MDIAKTLDPILTKPFSNYLGGNTALYETVQNNSSKMSGGKRRTRRSNKSRRRANKRRMIKHTRKTRSHWSR
jgi:hypothetical protein